MLPPAAQPFLPLQLLSAVLQPPLPLQEFLPLQPLSPVLCAGNAGSVGADSEGSGQETGNRSAGYDRFGWFHCLSTFSLFGFMVVIFATRN
jgi:hypothetical protein